jgi:cytochrome c oxidase subunit 2
MLNWEKLLGLPALASREGQDIDHVMIYTHWLMIALFVGWLGYFAYALYRFRASRHPKADYLGARTHASNYLEGAVALIEGVILLGFALPFWAKAADQFPKESESTVIKVAAQQFAWNVLYPGPDGEFGRQDLKFVSAQNSFGLDPGDSKTKDDIVTLNEIHVPVNKPVIVHISSKDVVHSFKVLAMRLTQDAIPGMNIPLHFVPTKVGVYQINCAQLCGNGHSGMAAGRLHVDTPEQYAAWLKSKSGAAAAPTNYE